MQIQYLKSIIMDFDDYETLPTNNFSAHMIAGATAGIMEHCVMYPFDSVKVNIPGKKLMSALTAYVVSQVVFSTIE